MARRGNRRPKPMSPKAGIRGIRKILAQRRDGARSQSHYY